jgi:excisionase family DNA binding protein
MDRKISAIFTEAYADVPKKYFPEVNNWLRANEYHRSKTDSIDPPRHAGLPFGTMLKLFAPRSATLSAGGQADFSASHARAALGANPKIGFLPMPRRKNKWLEKEKELVAAISVPVSVLPPITPAYLNIEQASAYLSVTTWTIRRLVATRKLAAKRIGKCFIVNRAYRMSTKAATSFQSLKLALPVHVSHRLRW